MRDWTALVKIEGMGRIVKVEEAPSAGVRFLVRTGKQPAEVAKRIHEQVKAFTGEHWFEIIVVKAAIGNPAVHKYEVSGGTLWKMDPKTKIRKEIGGPGCWAPYKEIKD